MHMHHRSYRGFGGCGVTCRVNCGCYFTLKYKALVKKNLISECMFINIDCLMTKSKRFLHVIRLGALVRIIDDEDIASGKQLNDQLGIIVEVIEDPGCLVYCRVNILKWNRCLRIKEGAYKAGRG